jgi:hypothetical protein
LSLEKAKSTADAQRNATEFIASLRKLVPFWEKIRERLLPE